MGGSKEQSLSKEEIGDLGAQMLTELWRVTVTALIDAIGSTKALELLKPNIISQGFAGALNIENRVRQLGYRNCDNRIVAAGVGYFVRSLMYRMTENNIEMTRSGLRGGEITACPFAREGPEICSILCDFLPQGSTQAIAPDLNFILRKKLSAGDPYCSWDTFIKGKKVDPPKDEAIAVLLKPRLSRDESNYWLYAFMGEAWAIASNTLVRYLGPTGAIDVLKPYMHQNGMSIGLQMKGKLNLYDHNAQSITPIMEICNAALQQKGQTILITPEQIEKEITECPFSGGAHEICTDLLSIRSNGICEVINPEYEFIVKKRMCKGDKTCHWVIKKKNPS